MDLRILAGSRGQDEQQDWEWAKRPKLQQVVPPRIAEPPVSPPGVSLLEKLPAEILGESGGHPKGQTGMLMNLRPSHISASTRLTLGWIYSAKR